MAKMKDDTESPELSSVDPAKTKSFAQKLEFRPCSELARALRPSRPETYKFQKSKALLSSRSSRSIANINMMYLQVHNMKAFKACKERHC